MDAYQSQSIRVAVRTDVTVDVKANADAVVLAQGNGVWFHDLHIEPEDALAIASALQEGALQCRAMRAKP